MTPLLNKLKLVPKVKKEKGMFLRFVLLLITNVLCLCITLINTQNFSLPHFSMKNYLSVFMLFYFSDTEPIILPADGDIDKEIGMLIHYRLF